MLEPLDLSTIDPGIRDMVAHLRAHGFRTTDSGDGVSKGEGAVLNFRHVFAVVDPADLVAESRRCAQVVKASGIPGDWSVEASYQPDSEIAIVGVLEHDPDEDEDAEEKGPWSVAAGIEDRAYGGPEEGGWWYQTFEPSDEHKHLTRAFVDRELARDYRAELDEHLENLGLNEGRPSIDSVNSIGRYTAMVFNGEPRCLPDEKPRYE